MPVKIFLAQGNKDIVGLEAEINKWQEGLDKKASVTHISTAATEHKEITGLETQLILTIWYEQ